MNCAVCGAPLSRGRTHCGICGRAREAESPKVWDRTVEAATFEDLQASLENGEALLGATRGRLIGRFRTGFSLNNARVLLSPYANLGLTAKRLVIQSVRPASGRAASPQTASIPLDQVRALTASDADPLAEGRTTRIEVHLATGDSFRLRASGRLARGAREVEEVWRTLCEQPNGARSHAGSVPVCPHCGRESDQPYRFCPFCGRELGEPD